MSEYSNAKTLMFHQLFLQLDKVKLFLQLDTVNFKSNW